MAASPGRGDLDRAGLVQRSLGGERELADRRDLVTPQLDPDGAVGGRWEDVEDASADRELTAPLYDVVAVVTHLDECFARPVKGDLRPHVDVQEAGRVSGIGHELHRPLSGGAHNEGVAPAEPKQRIHPLAHRLDRGRQGLSGEDLPSGEHLGPVTAQERMDIPSQALGFFRSGADGQGGKA